MSVPEWQIRVCMNEREPDASRPSCRNEGAKKLKDELKDMVKDAALMRKVRVLEPAAWTSVNTLRFAWCIRTMSGTALPRRRDAEKIVQQHLVGGKPVKRLLRDAPENLRRADSRK